MSSQPNDPHLLAVLLLIRTRGGPRFILHYPPSPLRRLQHPPKAPSKLATITTRYDNFDDTTSYASSTSEDMDESDSLPTAPSRRGVASRDGSGISRTQRSGGMKEPSEDEDEGYATPRSDKGDAAKDRRRKREPISRPKRRTDWDEVLGWSVENLSRLLCPNSREWHRRRFEVALESLVFLGCPMFARRSGGWERRKRKKKKKRKTKCDSQLLSSVGSATEDGKKSQGDVVVQESEASAAEAAEVEEKTSEGDEETLESPKEMAEEMAMFNVVFVMAPAPLEYQVRIKEVYDNVVKTLARALRYQQQESGYVWNEVRSLLSMRENARESGATFANTWPAIAESSSLATALASIFEAISASKIAAVQLGAGRDVWLQIPRPVSARFVPTPTSTQPPGLLLTTFNPIENAPFGHVSNDISPYSALLLLRGAASLVKEVEAEAGEEVAATVAFFIRSAGPTKSLQKLTKICRMSMRELQFLARHLIHWRRAIAIPPLNTTQTYVISPTADFSRLSEATAAFGRRFAALPSLPVILSYLGRTPREFGTIIPSKDHKTMYLEVLAWLIREGWVMQLRTFAWIRVSATIKATVHKIMEDERLEAAAAESGKDDDDENEDSSAEESQLDQDISRFSLGKRRISGGTADSKRTSLLSPRLLPHLRPARPASDAGSTGSARTAVPISAADRSPPRSRAGTAVERTSQRTLSRQSSNVLTVIGNDRGDGIQVAEIDASDFEPSLILSPAKADALESRWLDQIGSTLVDEELRAAWPNLSKYFDGNSALGEIAMREGLKRKSVNAWLNKLVEQEILMTVRHW